MLPALPLSLLTAVLSLALAGGAAYTLWGWYSGALVGMAYLLGGAAALLWALGGRWVTLRALGRGAADPPTAARTGEPLRLTRKDGTELRVEHYGRADGPTVVLTHGWGTDSTEWHYAKRSLGRHYRVLVWDLRGLGESGRPTTGDYRVETMAADLAAVVDLVGQGQGQGQVVLVGHSIGGMATLALCRHFPEYLAPEGPVAGVALVNTTHTTPLASTTASGFFSALRRPVLEPLLRLAEWIWPVMWLGAWLSYANGTAHVQSWLTGFTGRAPRGQLDYAALLGVKAHPGVLARGMRASFQWDGTAALPMLGESGVPALVVTGDGDRVLVPQVSARLAASLPGADLLVLPGARHQALLQRHEAFDAALVAFAARAA